LVSFSLVLPYIRKETVSGCKSVVVNDKDKFPLGMPERFQGSSDGTPEYLLGLQGQITG